MTPSVFDCYHGDQMTGFWEMKAAGIKLVIVKSSQDTSLDGKYYEYARRAAVTGMCVGAYHFGGNSDGKSQAERFLANVDKELAITKSGPRLLVLDFERYQPDQMTLSDAELFVQTIKAEAGVLPVLYYGELLLEFEANGKVAKDSILRQCPAWIARYGPKQPVAIAGQDLVMWQYTESGKVAGCANPCDLSVWVGNQADIPRFVAKHGRNYEPNNLDH